MSLPDRAMEAIAWRHAAGLGAALLSAPAGERSAAEIAQPSRGAVAGALNALALRVEQVLPPALAAAPQAWDRVDHLVTVFDAALTTQVVDVRRRLEQSAAAPNHPTLRAVSLEGLAAIDIACGLARLFEHRLSSLIRLRVRTGQHDLLPGGRPFLDLAAALKEAARAWA